MKKQETIEAIQNNKAMLANIVLFISNYRDLENASIEEACQIIKIVARNHQANHLCDQWRSKKKDFGSFFLNLSHYTQIKFLNWWGIADDQDEHYLEQVDKDQVNAYFLAAPVTCQVMHNIILFFNNHACESSTQLGTDLYLPDQPKQPAKRFGNSKNWGAHILSMAPQSQSWTLGLIAAYYDLKGPMLKPKTVKADS